MASLKSLTFKGVKWYLIGDVATIAANFVIGIILARLLTPTEYGTVGVYGIFFALAEIFVNGGFSMSLIQKKDLRDIDSSTAFWSNVIVGVVVFTLFELASPLIASFFKIPLLSRIVKVAAIGLLVGSFTVVQNTLFIKRVDFRTLSLIRFVSSVSSGALCILLAYKGFGVWSLVLFGLSSDVVRTILLWAFSKWRPKMEFSWQSFTELFSFGGRILGTRLLETLAGQASSFVLGKMVSPKDLGYYQKGASSSRMISSSISGALFGVSFPVLAKVDDDQTLLCLYKKYIKFSSMLVFFAMLLLCVLAHPLINFLYTEKWDFSASLMQIVIFGLMFDHLIGLNNNVFNVKGRGDVLLKLQIAKTTIMLSLLCFSARFGVYGICIAEVLYYQIAIALCASQTKKIIGYGYFSQMKDILPYLLKAIVGVLPAYLITLLSWQNIWILTAGSLASIITYILMLYLLKDEVFMQYVWNDDRVLKIRNKVFRK